ncbi:MAG: hypothetical protein AABW91_03680 [Nanoarchaeota archaeon]
MKAVKDAENTNRKIFQIKPQRYFIDIVYSNKEYDRKIGIGKVKTHRGGYVNKNRITIISPEVRKLSFSMEPFFYHEINHIFYTTLVGTYHPVWFSEGMSTYLMKSYKIDDSGWKNFFRSVKKPEEYSYYRYIKKKYYKNSGQFYTLSFFVYRYLSQKYGEKIILKLLKDFSKKPSQPYFDKLPIKYFKLTKKQIVQNAIR